MANNVKFESFHLEVESAMNDVLLNWLEETAYSISAHAVENCQITQEDKGQLASTYSHKIVDESDGTVRAHIGSNLESMFWEEFGTGSYADTTKNGGKQGRPGWWIYTPGSPGPTRQKSNTYQTKEDAEQMAAYIKAKYNKEAVVTNGRKPNYTLEKAYEAKKNKAINGLKRKLKERMEK